MVKFKDKLVIRALTMGIKKIKKNHGVGIWNNCSIQSWLQ